MNRDQFFAWLNQAPGVSIDDHYRPSRLLSECVEISAAEFDYFLNVLPPMHWTHNGFAICEATTDDLRLGFFTFPISGRYFAAYVSDHDRARSMSATRDLIIAACID
jgi:hypothetical protein